MLGLDGSQLDEEPRHGADPQLAFLAELVAVRGAGGPVDDQSWPFVHPRSGDRELDRCQRQRPQTENAGCRAVAEKGCRAAGEESRPEVGVWDEPGVADGVDGAVQRVEAMVCDQMLDLAPVEPELQELPTRDHTLLARGELRNGSHELPVLTLSMFAAIIVVNILRVGHGTQLTPLSVTSL